MARQFVTDCEGPISLNDNALELSEHYISPNGAKFFAKLSKYDDYLADIEKRKDYKAGDTLRLILPFLKAYGATNDGIASFSKKNIILVKGAPKLLRFVDENMDSFIISTSYELYIKALCEVVDFPFERTYCTRLDIDKHQIDKIEVVKIKSFGEEIDKLPAIDLPAEAKSLTNLSPSTQKTIRRLDEILWNEIMELEVGAILKEVNPIGGPQKANALLDSLKVTGNDLSQVMYVGDSITDVQALEITKRGGGLAVSFNGNRYAIEVAEIALVSDNTYITQNVADAFLTGGKGQVLRLLEEWQKTIIEKTSPPWAAAITEENKEGLIKISEKFRKEIRGVAGTLG